MVFDRLRLILDAQREGPFRLAGYCNGGMVALGLAKMLVEAGRQVDAVFLIDAPTLNLRPAARLFFQGLASACEAISPTWEQRAPPLAAAVDLVWRQAANLQVYRRDPALLRHAVAKLVRPGHREAKFVRPDLARLPANMRRREQDMARIYNRLFRKYVPPKTELPIVYFAAENDGKDARYLSPNVEVVDIPGGHWGCITTMWMRSRARSASGFARSISARRRKDRLAAFVVRAAVRLEERASAGLRTCAYPADAALSSRKLCPAAVAAPNSSARRWRSL